MGSPIVYLYFGNPSRLKSYPCVSTSMSGESGELPHLTLGENVIRIERDHSSLKPILQAHESVQCHDNPSISPDLKLSCSPWSSRGLR